MIFPLPVINQLMTADAPHSPRLLKPHSTYHVFNRGRNRDLIFRDEIDYDRFLAGFDRLLRPETYVDPHRNAVKPFLSGLSVIAYALMPNHFHLILHQREQIDAIPRFMARFTTGYSMYFNRRHRRSGKLYEGRFHAEPLPTAQNVRNAIVYVHRNPDEPLKAGRLTSHELYMGRKAERESHWCRADLGLKLFASRAHYIEHLHDAIAHRERERNSRTET